MENLAQMKSMKSGRPALSNDADMQFYKAFKALRAVRDLCANMEKDALLHELDAENLSCLIDLISDEMHDAIYGDEVPAS